MEIERPGEYSNDSEDSEDYVKSHSTAISSVTTTPFSLAIFQIKIMGTTRIWSLGRCCACMEQFEPRM